MTYVIEFEEFEDITLINNNVMLIFNQIDKGKQDEKTGLSDDVWVDEDNGDEEEEELQNIQLLQHFLYFFINIFIISWVKAPALYVTMSQEEEVVVVHF